MAEARSPFPGMDPFLEWRWRDLHLRLVVATAGALQLQLGNEFVAQIEERVLVEITPSERRPMGPDVRITEVRPRGERDEGGGTATLVAPAEVAVTQPVVLVATEEQVRQRFVQIVEVKAGNRLVTALEFVSPTNKRAGDGRRQYRVKQEECLDAGVNLVEVDLTRAGKRALLANRWPDARQHRAPYAASVWRAARPEEAALYPIRLRDRLPSIAVPLRAGDPDVVLNLASVFDACYAAARYDLTTRYAADPDPPLAPDDALWADALLRAAGAR